MLLALFAALALATDKPTPAADAQAATILRAVQDMTSGRVADALVTIEPVLAAYERDRAGDTRQPVCNYGSREMEAAGGATERQVATRGTGWCDALFVKGYALADLRRFAEAAPVLERLVAMAPYHAHFLNELGYVYQQQRDFQRSYDLYVRARDAAGLDNSDRGPVERTRGRHGVGYALIELGRWDEAEALFNDCLRTDPNDSYARNELTYIEGLRRRPRA